MRQDDQFHVGSRPDHRVPARTANRKMCDLRQPGAESLLLPRMPQYCQVSANTGTTAAERPCLRMQNLRQANKTREATATSARRSEGGTSLIRTGRFSSQKLVHALSAMATVEVLLISAERLCPEHINLWDDEKRCPQVNHDLRREADANPGNAGMRPGATGLTFRRGTQNRSCVPCRPRAVNALLPRSEATGRAGGRVRFDVTSGKQRGPALFAGPMYLATSLD